MDLNYFILTLSIGEQLSLGNGGEYAQPNQYSNQGYVNVGMLPTQQQMGGFPMQQMPNMAPGNAFQFPQGQ